MYNHKKAKILYHNNKVKRDDGDLKMIEKMTIYAKKTYIMNNFWSLSEAGDSSLDCAGS